MKVKVVTKGCIGTIPLIEEQRFWLTGKLRRLGGASLTSTVQVEVTRARPALDGSFATAWGTGRVGLPRKWGYACTSVSAEL